MFGDAGVTKYDSHEYDSPAWWCHILFDSFICKQATEDRQEMVVGKGGSSFLLLVWGGPKLPSSSHVHFYSVFSFFLSEKTSVCQRLSDPTSRYRLKYIDLLPFSITYSYFILEFRLLWTGNSCLFGVGYDWFPLYDHTVECSLWHQCRLDIIYFLKAFFKLISNY